MDDVKIYGENEEPVLSPVQNEVLNQGNKVVEITLNNGRIIKFKKFSGALSMKVATLLGDESQNIAKTIYYKMLLSICSLDGVSRTVPTTKVGIEALADILGDDFDEALFRFAQDSPDQPSVISQLYGSVETIKK